MSYSRTSVKKWPEVYPVIESHHSNQAHLLTVEFPPC